MRASRTLAAVSLAVLLGTGLVGTGHTLAHPARDVPASGYIFAGRFGGHIYRSADGGATWEEADAGIPATAQVIWSLAVAPDGTTVYAGTDRNGLWVSADDGTSWQPAGGSGQGAIPPDAQVRAVAIDPRDGRHLFAASYDGTVYQSRDGGRRWSSQLLEVGNLVALALDPQRPDTLLAGSERVSGLLISVDGGATWQDVGLSDYAYPHVTFDPRQGPDLAYASSGHTLYRSADGGRTWQQQDPAMDVPEPVAVDPSGLAGVLVGGNSYTAAIAYSADGRGWHPAALPRVENASISSFAFDPARPAHVLAAIDNGGLLVSEDSGRSWHGGPNLGDGNSYVWCFATTPRVPRPSDPMGPPSDLSHTRYFAATRHTLREPFLSFWDRHGNGPLFGSPITEPFTEDGLTVQYFERARLAYSGGQVTVSPLGLTVTSGRHFPRVAPITGSPSRLYFPSTGHTLAAPFLAYWQRHEGSTLMGPPISEPLREQNGDGTGRSYLVQYFKNMRLEYHPELARTPYVVSPGLIGREYLHRRGWI